VKNKDRPKYVPGTVKHNKFYNSICSSFESATVTIPLIPPHHQTWTVRNGVPKTPHCLLVTVLEPSSSEIQFLNHINVHALIFTCCRNSSI